MVELNFDHRRPPALLDLTRIAELRSWDVDGDAVRIGAGVPYTRIGRFSRGNTSATATGKLAIRADRLVAGKDVERIEGQGDVLNRRVGSREVELPAAPLLELLRMGRGAVIPLDASETDEVWILANNHPVARGEIHINEDKICISVTGAADVYERSPRLPVTT